VANTGPAPGKIADFWVLRWSPTAGIDVVFEKPSPTRDELLVYWALKPLNTSPMSGTFDGKTYSKFDLDVWAQHFLAAVDAFLAPQLAVAVALLDERHGTPYYQQLLSYKQQLAQAIPRSLANVLADQAGMGDAEQARERLSQALLSRLSNAYTVSTVVQAAAQVSIVGRADISTSPGAPPPQLYGSVGPGGASAASPSFSPSGASASRPYTFSPGELKLAGDGTPPNQWMTVLLTVADPSNQSEIAVPLTYQVNYLQHDFMTSEAYEGYVPSSWLKFILPSQPALTLPVTGPGSPAPVAQIPIPLPFVPDTPVLSDQIAKQSTAVASPASPTSIQQEIENAMRWDYLATVQHDWAAQDSLDFIITYNAAVSTAGVGARLGGSPTPLAAALFNALAPFVAGYPQLSAQFGAIVQEAYPSKGSPGPGSPGASAIIQQFTQLVGAVAEAWSSQPLALEIATGGTTRIDEFVLMPIPSSPDALSVRLRGRAVQPQSPSLPDFWPSLSPQGLGVTLPTWAPDPSQAQYKDGWWELEHTWAGLGPGAHIGTLDLLKLSWNALHVLDRQTAELSAYVVRNAELIQGAPTNPDFIYQTQTVRFANPAIPLIVAQPLPPLTPLQTLTETLEQIFAPMMGAGQTLDAFIRLEANYSYALVPGPEGDAVIASSAILLADDVMLDGGGVSPGTIAVPIAAEIGTWYRTHRLPSAGSRLNLAITLFATVELQQFPLVQFEDIPIRVDGVPPTWWQ
jgi:hypothetical protein